MVSRSPLTRHDTHITEGQFHTWVGYGTAERQCVPGLRPLFHHYLRTGQNTAGVLAATGQNKAGVLAGRGSRLQAAAQTLISDCSMMRSRRA